MNMKDAVSSCNPQTHMSCLYIWLLFLLEPVSGKPARLVMKMGDVSIPMRNKLRLECRFTGSPKQFVTWYKDGKQLYASYRYNTKVTHNACILEALYECNKDTPGKYSCEVSNAWGTDVCHAKVSVVTGWYNFTLLMCLKPNG